MAGAGKIAPVTVFATTGDCADGAVSDAANNPGLLSDCEALLSSRDTLEGTATLNWAGNTPISDWDGITVDGTSQRVSRLVLFGPVRGEILTGEIPPELGRLSSLQVLRLMFNQLAGEIPSQLGDLSSLRELDLSGNRLTGAIPPELGNLSNLQVLRLIFNGLDRGIPSQLGSLSDLQELWLSYNQLDGAIPPELGDLPNLDTLYLKGNDLTGCIPDGLRDVESNDFADLGLPFCEPQTPGAPTVSTAAVGTYMVRIDSLIPVTAAFSEPVSGFTIEDISVVNGSVGSLVGSNGDSVYTFDVTPNAIGDVTVYVAAAVAEDGDGNANTAAVQLSLGIPYDDDRDGAISRDEVITAIGDYLFSGLLTRDQVIEFIALYLFG